MKEGIFISIRHKNTLEVPIRVVGWASEWSPVFLRGLM